MFNFNDLQLELLKTQRALDMLSSVLSDAEFDQVCSGLIQHRDRIRRRLNAYGVQIEPKSQAATYADGYRTQKKLFDAWTQFINTGETSSRVSPLIAASWKRCWARVNPIQEIPVIRLNEAHLLTTQVASFDLISIARPIMEDIFQCIEKSGAVIMLVNSAGCLLDDVGDGDGLGLLNKWGIRPGTIVTEELVGTNAVGLALAERTPVQVVGAEHYLKLLHSIATVAAPIFSSSGRLLGALGMMMPLEKYHFYSLGLVAASARAIENQHQSDLLLGEQNSHLAQLNTILSSISDGILVWNADHVLQHANKAAGQLLDIPATDMVGKNITSFAEFPTFIRDAILEQHPLTDVETVIAVGRSSVSCMVNLNFVTNKSQLQWIIMTLRPEKQVRSLVTQQVGAIAPLTLEDIPGDSAHIQQVRAFVRAAAKAQASVLVRGETGTGKNALANAVHNLSSRRDGPFVIFACSSIPTELIIRDLLGHDEAQDGRRGGSRPSKFELAQGGTLFFQDVDALPLEAQAVLLNALESGMIQRVGNRRPIKIDVRVIASTSVAIETMIAQGSFRPDLYYWLSTFSITLSPLRERPRDIPLVVERILKRLALQWGLQTLELAPGVMEVLKRHSWPGNVREVEAVLGRAATQVGPGGLITLNLLPSLGRNGLQALLSEEGATPVRPMLELERDAILQAAEQCQGNVTLMAQTLEISRTTLWRRMREFGIQPRNFRGENVSK